MVMTGIYDVKTSNEMSKDWCLLTLVPGYILDHSDDKGILADQFKYLSLLRNHTGVTGDGD